MRITDMHDWPHDIADETLVTEPSQSYSPREIIRQFINQDIQVSFLKPSDDLGEVDPDNIIQFDDEFQAMDYLRFNKEYKEQQEKEKQEQQEKEKQEQQEKLEKQEKQEKEKQEPIVEPKSEPNVEEKE